MHFAITFEQKSHYVHYLDHLFFAPEFNRYLSLYHSFFYHGPYSDIHLENFLFTFLIIIVL
jgi:hypothetical protein